MHDPDECPVKLSTERAWYEKTRRVGGDAYRTVWVFYPMAGTVGVMHTMNGKEHRLDGPAMEHASGAKSWWVDGRFITARADDPKFKRAVLKYLMKIRG